MPGLVGRPSAVRHSAERTSAALSRAARSLIAGAGLLFVLGFLAGAPLEAQEARHLRHILVKNEEIADAILARLSNGADFREIARKYSLDAGTKPLGGDLDWVVPQQLEVEFARAAWAIAEKGGTAKVKTRHGWHVIEYVDSRPAPQAKPVPAPGPQPAPGEPGEGQPRVVPPVHSPPNDDLKVTMSWPRVTFAPGERVGFAIEVKNNTDHPIDVFHPDLWPLGLLVRYQFGPMNQNAMFPEKWGGTPPQGTTTMLEGGAALRREYVLQDYFGERPDWPIVRMIWRGDALFSRLEKLLPAVIETEGYPERKGRWRHYISEESRISVLPEYQGGDRWFLCAYARGRTWIEIQDPGNEGLIARLIHNVRTERYTDAQISQYHPDDFFAALLPPPVEPLAYEQPPKAIEWGPGVVGVTIEWADSQPVIGDTLCFALETPKSLLDRAIPIGRVVHTEGDPMARTIEVLSKGQTTPLSLLLAYPGELVPEEVRAAADALPEPARLERKLNPDPRAGWKPIVPANGDVRERPEDVRVPPAVGQEPLVLEEPPKLADDLPHVALVTGKGRIVVELFEDDAPNTVANFIHLVDTGFYRENQVLRRETSPVNRGFIQTGSPDNTVKGTPGYTIRDERNGHRHVRGALSMARKHQVPHSAGSQFFVCIDSQPQLDGTYTVFGRVLEGMEIVDGLQKGDVIESMEIVRKRDHEYVPQTTPQ